MSGVRNLLVSDEDMDGILHKVQLEKARLVKKEVKVQWHVQGASNSEGSVSRIIYRNLEHSIDNCQPSSTESKTHSYGTKRAANRK